MPHSGGGGSHSGGSHHSSHRSHGSHSSHHSGGGGSHRGGIRKSDTPFKGSRTFVTYDRANHTSKLVYANTSKYSEGIRIADVIANAFLMNLFTIFGLFFVGLGIFAIFFKAMSFGFEKTKYNVSKDDIVIMDEYDYISDEDEDDLKATLVKFRDETGIIPAIEFTNDAKWSYNYDDMESFAYNEYVCNFDDEYHLLIVYSYGYIDSSTGFNEFNWESMWGDKLSKTADEKDEDKLKEELQKEFSRANGEDVAGAVETSFETFERELKKKDFSVDWEYIILGLIYIGFGGIGIMTGVITTVSNIQIYIKEKKESPAYYRIKGEPKMARCSYCDGSYYLGTVTCCPYCGAPITETSSIYN